ncbi:FAD-dependent oxidoreductase, partial [Bacillus pumilus]|uniref:FAD-dependent oxidoreductase n=1 Tax=Bacillus pumilus TaxID=1408 RepID=UPI001642FCE9
KTEIQPHHHLPPPFSYQTVQYITDQLPSSLTYTTLQTHQIIHHNLHPSPIYSPIIKPTPPTYSPSIQHKLLRFN